MSMSGMQTSVPSSRFQVVSPAGQPVQPLNSLPSGVTPGSVASGGITVIAWYGFFTPTETVRVQPIRSAAAITGIASGGMDADCGGVGSVVYLYRRCSMEEMAFRCEACER